MSLDVVGKLARVTADITPGHLGEEDPGLHDLRLDGPPGADVADAAELEQGVAVVLDQPLAAAVERLPGHDFLPPRIGTPAATRCNHQPGDWNGPVERARPIGTG